MDRQTAFMVAALCIAAGVVGYVVFFNGRDDARIDHAPAASRPLAEIPVNGQRAYEMLQRICELGSRMSGSAGMVRQREMLTEHFEKLGGKVEHQTFNSAHPLDGSPVEMENLIVRWQPESRERILLCAHYDTRPFPDRDPDRRKRNGLFLGANDGASGVAVLAELAHHMSTLDSPWGVDFAFFDAEEFIFDERRDEYFIGSRHFARQYVTNPPEHRYRCAVLLDMVGDAQLQVYQEQHSVEWPDTRPVVQSIWRVARDLGVREFVPQPRYKVRDDHLMLHDVAGIPSCNIIDFDYPHPRMRRSYWHTTQDTPDKCSALSLAKVGWVVLEWLKQLE